MGKYFIILCISLLSFACSNNESWLTDDLGSPVTEEKGEKKFTGLNPETGSYPGGRGGNDLIIYTPDYGKRTETNEWGVEAIVKDGIIVSIGHNDSEIPQNGFVISGNGESSKWINDTLKIGMKVELKNEFLHYSYSENADVRRARIFYRMGLKRIKEKNIDFIGSDDIKRVNQQLGKSYSELIRNKKKNAPKKIRKAGSLLSNIAVDFYYRTFSYSGKDEFRGVWIRISDKTPEGLRATVESIAEAGFNAILPETIYNGYAIYPNHSLLHQMPQFHGWDPMKILVEECEKYNIQLIPWAEMFFVGRDDSPVVKEKSDWLAEFRNGKKHATLEPAFCYLCPARPEVHDFLLGVLKDVAGKYEIDGIQLDYIRYSLSIPWDKGMCYCEYCQSEVKKKYGFDILKITPDDAEWSTWNDYRANNITSFVTQVNELFNSEFPDLPISTDVFPDKEQSKIQKMQDWSSWVQKGMIDELFIMNYHLDNNAMRQATLDMLDELQGTSVKPIVGLGPFMGYKPHVLLEQIEISREEKTGGVCLFSWHSLSEKDIHALKKGAFFKQ
ncbi:glycoside hydrolase family 10 protein [Marinilabilia salmonicolor]|uniref:glycoside hydrolase family 10 protein n=1 Tax=Marinilabilia salmonicolor TaxID=989 RepID=UPI00029A00F6|nr:family 10 glycosylhydrolase [Marinilabilia salmonicolor]